MGARREPQRGSPAPAGGNRLPVLVILIVLAAPLLNTLPTLAALLQAHEPDRVFVGFRYMVGDHLQYGSLVRQAADEGRFLFENRFTTEEQRPSYILLFFWLSGIASRLTGLGFPAIWETAKVACGAAFLLAVWSLTGRLFRERSERILALSLVAFAGGVGGAALLLPPEVLARPGYPGETDPVNYQWNWSTFSAFLLPLWIAPSCLLAGAAALLGGERPVPGPLRWAAGLAIPPAIWFMHPHTGNAAYLALGLFALAPVLGAIWKVEPVRWPEAFGRAAEIAPFLLSFGIVLLYLRWAGQDAVFAANSRATLQWNPNYSVFLYPVAYGLLLPLAAFGLKWASDLPGRARQILAAWLAAAFLLSVNPYYSGAKFQYLLHPPLALFAAHGLIGLRRRSGLFGRLTRGGAAAGLGLLLFANVPVSLLKDLPAAAADRDIWVTRDELDAMRFLDGQPAGPVLCGSRAGNRIAYFSRKKVYAGHWLLTLNQQAKEREVAGFLHASVGTAAKKTFLAERGIRYVWLGPDERAMGDVDPGLGLETVWERGSVRILRVP